MKQLFYLIITSLVLFSCKQSAKKFTDGTEYKIISGDSKGKKIENGNFIEVEILKKYKDSVLYDSREMMPQFGLYDTAQFPPLFKVIFKNIKVGDSVYTRNLVDSIYKTNLPPYAKKGEYEVTTYKFTNVYKTKEETDAAYNKWLPIAKKRSAVKINEQIQKDLKANEAQLKTDDKIITDYIAAHQLAAVKAPWGTYVVITNPGSGDNLTDTSIAVVKYTGKTLADSVFDSNVDPKFGHTDPINVDLGQMGSGIILGWIDALKQMKKGSKGKFLIPSSLAYGKTGSGDRIKPNEILIFDVEIVDVITPAQYQAQQMEQQRKMMEMQQKMQQMQQQGQQGQQAPPPQK